MRPAVITTAGRRSPASLPVGVPRSSSTTSPGVSIEPRCLLVAEFRSEVPSHGVLTKCTDRLAHRLIDRFVALGCQSGHPRVGVSTDADCGGLGHGSYCT